MRAMKCARVFAAWTLAISAPHMAGAEQAPLTGVFHGQGRACFGGLFVRTQTIEWTSSFSKCGPTRYVILDQALTGEHPRIAYQLEKRSRQCRNVVIELMHYEGNVWDVKGYPSVESYQKRDLPDWKNSVLPDRAVTSCGMFKQ